MLSDGLKAMCKVAAVALLAGLAALPAIGGSVASKVELLGEPDYLVVDEIRSARRNGMLVLQVTIRNTSASDRQMRYRFRWLDGRGFDVGTEEAWKPIVLHGEQIQRIQAVAPMPQAEDFSLQIHADNNDAHHTGATTFQQQ